MSDVRTIRVFIASPGDLAVERAAFKQVLEELNAGFGDALDITFEPLGWEDTLGSTGRRSQEVINREIDRCDASRLGLRPDRVSIWDGRDGVPTYIDFRKSLEESLQVMSHGFATEAEFKAEVNRHLRAFAKGELPPANAPRDKVLLPLAILAEVQKEKAEWLGQETGHNEGCEIPALQAKNCGISLSPNEVLVMSLITVEVEIDHGSLTAKESHRLPERGVGLLTVVSAEEKPQTVRNRVTLPLVHCVPGTIVNPTAEDLDDSLWD